MAHGEKASDAQSSQMAPGCLQLGTFRTGMVRSLGTGALLSFGVGMVGVIGKRLRKTNKGVCAAVLMESYLSIVQNHLLQGCS